MTTLYQHHDAEGKISVADFDKFYNPPAGKICSILFKPLLFGFPVTRLDLILSELVDVEGK